MATIATGGRRTWDAAVLAAGLGTLAFAWWLASFDRPSEVEVEVFRAVNQWPDWIEGPGWVVMQAGSAVAILVVAVAVAALWRSLRTPVAVLIAGWLAWLLAKVIKDLVGRSRPAGYVDDVIERPEWEGLGFVSGHAAVAFAIATVLSPHLRGAWRWAAWAIAAAVGILRIYTGAHLPLDVVGGAALGIAVGYAVSLALGATTSGDGDADGVEDTAEPLAAGDG